MAIIESRLSKYKRQLSKINHLPKKDYTVAARPSSDKRVIVSGGVVHVQVQSTRTADGGYDINLKKVAARTKNSYGVFVAGGSEVDRLVATANANVPMPTLSVVDQRRKYTSFKDYLMHRKP